MENVQQAAASHEAVTPVDKKSEIKKRLPENIVPQLKEYLAKSKHQAEIRREPFNEDARAYGWVMERLAEAEFATDLSPAVKELLQIFKHPEDYKELLSETFVGRVPDYISLEITEEGDIVILATVEVKGGELDERSLMQLDPDEKKSEYRFLLEIVEKINKNRGQLSNHKLNSLASRGKISISPNFVQKLVVTGDKTIEYNPGTNIPTEKSVGRLVHTGKRFSDLPTDLANEQRQDLINLLMDPKKILIVNSSFSKSEVSELTRDLLKKTREYSVPAEAARKFLHMTEIKTDETPDKLREDFDIKGDITVVDAAIIRATLGLSMLESSSIGVNAEKIDQALHRIDVVLKKSDTKEDLQATKQLNEIKSALEDKRTRHLLLLDLVSTVHEWSGSDNQTGNILMDNAVHYLETSTIPPTTEQLTAYVIDLVEKMTV